MCVSLRWFRWVWSRRTLTLMFSSTCTCNFCPALFAWRTDRSSNEQHMDASGRTYWPGGIGSTSLVTPRSVARTKTREFALICCSVLLICCAFLKCHSFSVHNNNGNLLWGISRVHANGTNDTLSGAPLPNVWLVRDCCKCLRRRVVSHVVSTSAQTPVSYRRHAFATHINPPKPSNPRRSSTLLRAFPLPSNHTTMTNAVLRAKWGTLFALRVSLMTTLTNGTSLPADDHSIAFQTNSKPPTLRSSSYFPLSLWSWLYLSLSLSLSLCFSRLKGHDLSLSRQTRAKNRENRPLEGQWRACQQRNAFIPRDRVEWDGRETWLRIYIRFKEREEEREDAHQPFVRSRASVREIERKHTAFSSLVQ